jgi:hypothetical protein
MLMDFNDLVLNTGILFYNKFILQFHSNPEIIGLLRWMNDKCTFVKKYHEFLVRKSTHIHNFDFDLEMQRISLFQQYLPYNSYLKIHTFFSELKHSMFINRDFRSIIKSNVNVFSNIDEFRPMVSDSLPLELKKVKTDFEKYYRDQFPSRKLSWDFYYGNLIVTYNQTFDIEMTVLHFIVIDCILKNNNVTIQKLVEILQWDEYLISGILHSLSNHRYYLLCKTGIKNKIDTNLDIFSFNPDFNKYKTHSHIRFILPNRQSISEKEKIISQDDLIHQIRSKLVFIIKRENMTELQLREELCHLTMNYQLIKEQLDYLMDKEYIIFENSVYIYNP